MWEKKIPFILYAKKKLEDCSADEDGLDQRMKNNNLPPRTVGRHGQAYENRQK